MAQVIPFPLVKRRDWIAATAARMADRKPDVAEKLLATALSRKRDAMVSKAIPDDVIAAELNAAECAIRAKLWALVLTGGDVA